MLSRVEWRVGYSKIVNHGQILTGNRYLLISIIPISSNLLHLKTLQGTMRYDHLNYLNSPQKTSLTAYYNIEQSPNSFPVQQEYCNSIKLVGQLYTQ